MPLPGQVLDNLTPSEHRLVKEGFDKLQIEAAEREREVIERIEDPKPVKIYYCKECDFSTPDRYGLTSHYSSEHSWHHRKEEEKTSQPAPVEERTQPEPAQDAPAPPVSLKPANWVGMKYPAKAQWYDRHKDRILKDHATLKRSEFEQLWGIASSTLHGLRQRWASKKRSAPKRRPVLTPEPAEREEVAPREKPSSPHPLNTRTGVRAIRSF